jgi:DNA processing protein
MFEPRIIDPNSSEWPWVFRDLPADYTPERLWVRGDGNLEEFTNTAISIIGARASTAYGDHTASDIANGLATNGWTVVSGGALGIDGAAHRGALAADSMRFPGTKGRTIAVLASGVDVFYPAAHHFLFEHILRNGGLIVSEYPPGSHPHRSRFLERNRLIAAMSGGMVMVEAGQNSGSTAAFGHARTLKRKLMVVPGPVTSAYSKGTNYQLRFADVSPVGTAAEVEEVMNA